MLIVKARDRFKLVRKALNLSQSEMATFLDSSLTTIHRWENAEPRMTESNRKKLAEFGINPSYIDYDQGDVLREGYNLSEVIEAVNKEVRIKKV